MRGKQAAEVAANARGRNIPAYAGKTEKYSVEGPVRQEHPRVCGENGFWHALTYRKRGTSPRMRGKPGRLPQRGQGVRNIPAYAGKTC